MADLISGSEQSWREASDPKNPRHQEKQRDITNLVSRYKAKQDEVKEKFEQNMEAEYFEAGLEVANRMLGNSKTGYSRKYAQNFDKAFKEE